MKKTDRKNAPPAIRALIAMRGLTQAQISRKTGFHESYVSRILSGERSPRVYVMHKIAKVLEVSIEHLVKSIALGGTRAA